MIGIWGRCGRFLGMVGIWGHGGRFLGVVFGIKPSQNESIPVKKPKNHMYMYMYI